MISVNGKPISINAILVCFVVVFLGIFLSSCNTDSLSEPTATFRILPATWTPLPSKTPTPTVTITVTVTQPTLTPTLLSTLEQLPTQSTALARSTVLDLLDTNGDCEYPCWWGITPGVTSWAQARNYLESFAYRIGDVIHADGNTDFVTGVFGPRFYVPGYINPRGEIVYKIYVEGGVVEKIEGAGVKPISWFLNKYGEPEDIWVRTIGKNQTGYAEFFLALYYPQERLFAWYVDRQSLVSQTEITACFNDPQITLWSQNQNITFEDVPFLGTENWKTYPTLEEATGYTVEQFYEQFRSADKNVCVTSPTEIWSYPVD